ncbi:MAG: hypothetical protein QM692_01405 [Thermomicrobiales bacterium]
MQQLVAHAYTHEDLPDLFIGKGQIVVGDLSYVAVGTEASEGDPGYLATHEDDMRGVWQIAQELPDTLMNDLVFDEMVVIEYQDGLFRPGAEPFGKMIEGNCRWRGFWVRGGLVDGTPDFVQKRAQHIVLRSDLIPAAHLGGVGCDPLVSQGRLAIAGGSRDQGDRRKFRCVDQIEQSLAQHTSLNAGDHDPLAYFRLWRRLSAPAEMHCAVSVNPGTISSFLWRMRR